jgi:exosortase
MDKIKKALADVPGSFLFALALAAGFMEFTAWDQSSWWRLKEDYTFGWLVPLFVAFVVHDRWPKIAALLNDCASGGAPEPAGVWRWVRAGVLGAMLIPGLLLFLAGALYRASSGLSNPGSLAITLGMASLVLPLIFMHTPVPAGPGPRVPGWRAAFAGPRIRLTLLFLFPVLVWIVSAPLANVVESDLSLFLLNKVTQVVFFTFEMLGLPIEREGNVLVLPTGRVGIAEACSGIRSLTACLFAGSFLGAVFLDRLWKKIGLVACAMALAFLTNLVRGLFLTGWAYHFGPAAIEGTVHDLAGYVVLGFTCVGLLCMIPLFNLQLTKPDEAQTPSAPGGDEPEPDGKSRG